MKKKSIHRCISAYLRFRNIEREKKHFHQQTSLFLIISKKSTFKYKRNHNESFDERLKFSKVQQRKDIFIKKKTFSSQ